MNIAIVNTLFNSGTTTISDDANLKRSINIVNRMAVIPALMAFILAPFLYYLSGFKVMLYMPMIEGALLFMIPVLNQKGMYFQAAMSMIAIHCGSTFYFGCIIGELACVEFIAVYLVLMAFIIYKDSQRRAAMIMLIVCTFILLKLNYSLHFIEQLSFPANSVIFARVAIQIAVIFLVGYVVWFHIKDADQRLSIEEVKAYLKEQQIASLKAAKDSLFGEMKVAAHEIRNYMSNISGLSEKFDRQLKNAKFCVPVEKSEATGLKVCKDAILSVVESVLVKGGKKNTKNSIDKFLWKDWINDMVAMYQLSAAKAGVSLFASIKSSEFKYISGNKHLLTKVLSNSISNAVKHCKKNVRIEANLSNSHILTIEVLNDGSLNDEVRKKIADDNLSDFSDIKDGHGFGLPTLLSATKHLRGSLAVGSGKEWATSFLFSFPVDIVEEGAMDEVETDSLEVTPSENIKDLVVLAVEDNEHSALPYKSWAKTYGFTLWIAGTLQEAMEVLSFEVPDIVFLDVHLPDGHGIDAYNKIRTVSKDVPVVIATGYIDVEMEEGEMDIYKRPDIFGLVQKPIKEAIFLETIQPLLKN